MEGRGQRAEDPRHGLPCPALSGRDPDRAARGRRHPGHGKLLRHRQRRRTGDARRGGRALRLHRRPGSRVQSRGYDPAALCLHEDRRGLRQPLRLLRDPVPAGSLPQPEDGGLRRRGRGSGRRRRPGADRGGPGYLPLRRGSLRQAHAARAASPVLPRGGLALDPRPLHLSRRADRRADRRHR